MKIVPQMAIVFGVAVLGEMGSEVIPVSFPGSVMGMVIMYLLLSSKLLKVDQVSTVSDFLIMNMAILFIPLAVGVVEVYPLIKEHVWGVGIMCVLTTLLTFGATLGTALLVLRFQDRGRRNAGEGE